MPHANDNTKPSDSSWMGTLSTAAAASLTLAVLFGLADSVVADVAGFEPDDGLGRLGCYAAAIGWYALMLASILVPLGVLTHASWGERSSAIRLRRLLGLGLFGTLCLEIFARGWPPTESPLSTTESWGLLGAILLGAAFGAWMLAGALMRLPRAVHFGLRMLGVAALIGGVWFVQAEQLRLDDFGKINERNERLPNLLLVVADSLRADQLGSYGSKTGMTPNLDELAARGVVVENCIAQAATTRPSLASILTGQFPRRWAAASASDGERSSWRPLGTLQRLVSASTLAGSGLRLRTSDYVTAHFDRGSGAAPGFSRAFGAMPSQWRRFQFDLPMGRMERQLETWLLPAQVEDSAIAWMSDHEHRRWMARVSLDLDGDQASWNSRVHPDGVAHLDARVGSLLGRLSELGLIEQTLVVFTAAHGDESGDLRQLNLHVPLLLANTRLLPHGKRVTDLVESVDLVPTLCDLIGLELPNSKDDLTFDGRSFVPAILGTQVSEVSSYAPKHFAFSESADSLSIQTLEAQLIAPRDLVDDEDRRRFFRELKRVRYIDLQAGPTEPDSLDTFQDRRLSEMWTALREYDRRLPAYVEELPQVAHRAPGEVQAKERAE